jgi:hypothetical protein
MGRICSTCGEMRNPFNILVRNSEKKTKKNHLGDLNIDRR